MGDVAAFVTPWPDSGVIRFRILRIFRARRAASCDRIPDNG